MMMKMSTVTCNSSVDKPEVCVIFVDWRAILKDKKWTWKKSKHTTLLKLTTTLSASTVDRKSILKSSPETSEIRTNERQTGTSSKPTTG